jgi:hypothetical protein
MEYTALEVHLLPAQGHQFRHAEPVAIGEEQQGRVPVPMPSEPTGGGDEQERHQVAELAKQVQEATGDSVELAFVDQAYTGEQAAQDAEANHMKLEVVKRPEARRGFVLLPRR